MRVHSPTKRNRDKSMSPERRQSPKKGEQLNKRQIQATLNQLHRLQSEIYELNVPQNPHSSAPVKKQIKQLAYLYENMTKPKQKNNLDIKMKQIEKAIRIMNEGNRNKDKLAKKDHEEVVSNQKVDIKVLGGLMKKIYQQQFDVSLISESKSNKPTQVTSQEIYSFVNFNDFDHFDPMEDTYEMFLNEEKKFSFTKYNELNEMLGMPKIEHESTFRAVLGLQNDAILTFEQFKKVMNDIIH